MRKESAPCRYSYLYGTRISQPPGGIYTAPVRVGRRGRRAAPAASARGRAQAPRQGRSGQGRPERAGPAPAGASRRLLGLTATLPPPAGDTAEPLVQPGRAAAASALLPPGGAAPHGQALGRPRSPSGGEKERGRGGPEERRWVPGTQEGSGGGGSRAAPASPVPAGPARLRPRHSRFCRVQLPPGPPRRAARPGQSAPGTTSATNQSAERTRPRPAPPAARPRPPTFPPGLSRDTRGGGARHPTANEKSQRVPPQPIGGRTALPPQTGRAGGGNRGVTAR